MNDSSHQTATTTAIANGTDEQLAEMVDAGRTALEDGDLRHALGCYQAVIDAFPERPEGHNNLGALWASLGEWTRAEACFARVVELLPDNPHVLYNRGVMRSHLERHASACEDFAAALALSPHDPDLHNNLGVSHFLRGNPDGARRHLEAALRLRPDYANAVLNLCDVDEACDDLALAVRRCTSFLAGRQDATVRRRLFELQSAATRAHLDAACGTAESLLAAHPDDTQLRQKLGRLMTARQALGEPAQRAHAEA
jgi:Flp pilus assembly protein TadD